jgi:nuclear pore complex protein Nup62
MCGKSSKIFNDLASAVISISHNFRHKYLCMIRRILGISNSMPLRFSYLLYRHVCVRVYMCMYVCVCMFVCMYMCVCTYVSMYVCMFVSVCVCMHTCMYVCVCVYVCVVCMQP